MEAEPKLMVVLSATASLSCFLLVLDSSSLEMALVLQSHPSPPWQQRGLVPAVGQWERQLPGVPQGFFSSLVVPVLDLLEHRACVISFLWLLSRPGRVVLALARGFLNTPNRPCEKGSSY